MNSSRLQKLVDSFCNMVEKNNETEKEKEVAIGLNKEN